MILNTGLHGLMIVVSLNRYVILLWANNTVYIIKEFQFELFVH